MAIPGYCLGSASVLHFAIITAVRNAAATLIVDTTAAALTPPAPGTRVQARYYTFGVRHRIKTGPTHVLLLR